MVSFQIIPQLKSARGSAGLRDYVAIKGWLLVLWGITKEVGTASMVGVPEAQRKSSWVGNYS